MPDFTVALCGLYDQLRNSTFTDLYHQCKVVVKFVNPLYIFVLCQSGALPNNL